MSEAELDHEEPTRRDFVFVATGVVAAVGAGATVWPFVDQMNPAADTKALSSAVIDVSLVPEGSEIRVLIGGLPFFVRHRTAEEIARARADDTASMKDPQTDDERLIANAAGEKLAQFLILSASCTHLGCVPSGPGTDTGEYGGWFCPCHGSAYDTSGRIRRGPAPTNLPVPKYEWVSDTSVKISL